MEDMKNLQNMAAATALNKMMRDSHFSICTIDNVAKMMGVKPTGESYRILSSIHCVDFCDMPRELRQAIPQLVADVLGDPTFQFQVQPKPEPVVEPATESRGILQRLGIKL